MLYHLSEDSTINHFAPRQKSNRLDMPPVVWAIDQEHVFSFYCPRNCPRIVLSRKDEIAPEVEQQLFGQSSGSYIMAVENAWYDRIRTTPIYKYTFPEESFALFDRNAGYYISHEAVTPLHMERIDDPIQRLIDLDIELRFVPNLHPLRDAVLATGYQGFSFHRFVYAAPLIHS